MEKLQIKNLKQTGNYYTLNDKPLTNFTLSVRKQIKTAENSIQYLITVYINDEIYTITVSPYELRNKKFLQNLPVYIYNENKFYKLLQETIFEMSFNKNSLLYVTDCNGLQKLNNKWIYVYTNGSITVDGFNSKISSNITGMVFPEALITDTSTFNEAVTKMFNEYNLNYKIFYPMFLLNIMAITNRYFREIGEPSFMKLTLWIDGKSGSGKTVLTKTAGTYTYADTEMNKPIIFSTGNRRYALKELSHSSGSVFILDDVKSEKIRERRNSVKNIIDDCLRSIFQGELTDVSNKKFRTQQIDSCAIITGEYMDNQPSQNARLIYLRVDNFVNDKTNSKSLRVLHSNPEWLTIVCGHFITWFLKRIEEKSFSDFLKSTLNELRSKENWYERIDNSQRLNENRHMLEMAAILALKFFNDTGMSSDFTDLFNSNCQKSIKSICDSTFCLLGGEEMIIYSIFEKIFDKCTVRKAIYKKTVQSNLFSFNDFNKYYQPYFWINESEDFVYIEDYKKSLLDCAADEYEQYQDKPYLIIRENHLIKLFECETNELVQKQELSSEIADNINTKLLKMLRKMQIIYKQYRSDSKWGRPSLNYPVCTCECKHSVSVNTSYNDYNNNYYDYNDSDTYETTIYYDLTYEPVIHINTEHPFIKPLIKQLKETTETYYLDSVYKWKFRANDNNILDSMFKLRKAFMNNKSLYKE